jgi:hypothetical protein
MIVKRPALAALIYFFANYTVVSGLSTNQLTQGVGLSAVTLLGGDSSSSSRSIGGGGGGED